MGNACPKVRNQSEEQYHSKFVTDFQDVQFIGKTEENTIQILKSKGYYRYIIWRHSNDYISSVSDGEVIICSPHGVLIKEPYLF